MSESEKAAIGDRYLKLQNALRRKTYLADKAKRKRQDLSSADSILDQAIRTGSPRYTELPGFPERDDVERLLCSIKRNTETIRQLRKDLGEVTLD